jgi:EAL domain-containing protein (putative c-di-GMP-specific phosphodiesterase class I)
VSEAASPRCLEAARRAVADVLAGGPVHHVFQPILALETGEFVGFEALARFGADLSPQLVWEAAEDLGVTATLDHLSVQAALAAAANLPGVLFVNLAAASLAEGAATAAALVQAAQRFREPGTVVVEVTEGALRDVAGARRTLSALKAAGLRIALDDAGAGFSTVERLSWLAPAFVKIDRPVMEAWLRGEPSGFLAWLAWAHLAGARVIAEGVERSDDLEALQAAGIAYVQGYAVGRPLPASAWLDRLGRHAGRGGR